MSVRYGGLLGRTLTAASLARYAAGENIHEDKAAIPEFSFRLGAVETEIVGLVKKLCEPLFVICDYASFPDDIDQQIVTDFVKGKIT